jgi:two-component system LytT family sensor kinase
MKIKKLSKPVVRAFALTLAFLSLLSWYIQYNQTQQQKEQMDYIAGTLGSETYETLLSQLSKTRVLEAYLIETGGSDKGFDEIAAILLQEPYVRNVLFAPNGVVETVYPLKGNESVVGLDMRKSGAGNLEAQAAIAKGELYMAGPFELVQGGYGIAGRLPVYLKDASGQSYFWGVVSVTLDYPAVLGGSSIANVGQQGFSCKI